MSPQDLVHAPGMLESGIARRLLLRQPLQLLLALLRAAALVAMVLRELSGYLHAAILPTVAGIIVLVGFPAGEHPVQIVRALVAVLDDGRDICVVQDILPEPQIPLQYIVDQSTQKHDVGAGAYRRVDVGQR